MFKWCSEFDNLADFAPLMNQEALMMDARVPPVLASRKESEHAQANADDEEPRLLCQEAHMPYELSNSNDFPLLNQEAQMDLLRVFYSYRMDSNENREEEQYSKKNNNIIHVGPPLNQEDQLVNRLGAFREYPNWGGACIEQANIIRRALMDAGMNVLLDTDEVHSNRRHVNDSQEGQLVVLGHKFESVESDDASTLQVSLYSKPPDSHETHSFQSLTRGAAEQSRALELMLRRRQRQQEAWWVKMRPMDREQQVDREQWLGASRSSSSGKINGGDGFKSVAFFLASVGFASEALRLASASTSLWDNEAMFRALKNSKYGDEQLSRMVILCSKMADDTLLAKRMKQLFSYGHEPQCMSREEALAGLQSLISRGFVETLQVIYNSLQGANILPKLSARALPEIAPSKDPYIIDFAADDSTTSSALSPSSESR